MRIAYVINQYPKVSHSFIRREILALERQGHDIMRIALRGWNDELVDPEDRAERARTRYVLRDKTALLLAMARMALVHPVRYMKALGLIWQISRKAERPLPIHLIYLAEACRIELWLRQAGAQHVHAHFGTNSAEVAMLVHVLGGPQWSFTVHGPEEFDKAPLIGLAEKISQCSFVIAVSSYGRSQLYRLVDQQHWSKVHVIHCGLDRTYFEVPENSPPATRRLVCVGRLCEQKGHLLLLEAARRLARDGTDFELVIAGDGELRGEIDRVIAHYGLNNIRITGWISGEQVRDEILAARALVLPSFAEGLPVVIMEAMALRRPIIGTYVGGIPELVLPIRNGWLVPAGDADALCFAMRSCLEASADTIEIMGDAGCKRVLARHNVETEAAKLSKLFQLRCQEV